MLLIFDFLTFVKINAMLSLFEEFVKKNRLFGKKHKLLLAISGGEDSVCLFHLLLEGAYDFELAHCNFGLRGKESDADQDFIVKLSEKHRIKLHLIKFETKKKSEELGLGTQETARFLRYEWFEILKKDFRFDRILTAHHKGDNTETMLINLIRSTGISGLHGIPISNRHICRPLMFATSQEISEYLEMNRHKFRLDKSNLSDDYLRNRLRHHVIPELRKINAEIDEAFYKTSLQILEFERLGLELMAEKWSEIIIENSKGILLPFDRLNGPDAIENLDTMLFYCLRPMGFNRSQTDLLKAGAQSTTGFRIESETHEIIRERNGFLICTKTNHHPENISINDLPDKSHTRDYELELIEIPKDLVDFSQSNCLYLDLEKIEFPIKIRSWKKGDKLIPLGMTGHKNVSDILTDRKVPNSERSRFLVIVNNDDQLIAMLPNLISDKFKVGLSTSSVLRITVKAHKFVNT